MTRRKRDNAGKNLHGRSRYNEHTGHHYEAGDHWVECMRCGFDVRESNSKREWNGLIVCEGCWDPRHPQDFVRGRRDDTAARGNTNPTNEYDRTEVAGSTSNPAGTFGDYLSAAPSGALAPSEVSDLLLWWDYSESDGNFLFADESRTTPITDGVEVQGVEDRSGNGHHGVRSHKGGFPPGQGPTWDTNTRNGNGAGNFDMLSETSARSNDTGDGTIDPALNWAGGWTVLIVAEVPIANASNARVLFGHRGITGTVAGFTQSPGFTTYMETMISNSVVDNTAGAAIATSGSGAWHMHEIIVTPDTGLADCWLTSTDRHTPPFAGHDSNSAAQVTFRLGAGTDTLANHRNSWDGHIGEGLIYNRILTASERAGLWLYFQNKWALTDTI
jgi:hypothetical protein